MREQLLYQEHFGFDWKYPGACRNAVLSRFKWEALYPVYHHPFTIK